MRVSWPYLAAALLAAQGAHAQSRPRGAPSEHAANVDKDADAYCRWVKAIAASTADVLVAPQVYATAGYVSGADVSPGAASVPPTQRLIAAGLYSFGGLNRGLATMSQADAECRRYRA